MMQNSNAVVTSLNDVKSGWVYSFELADQSVGCSGESGMLVVMGAALHTLLRACDRHLCSSEMVSLAWVG